MPPYNHSARRLAAAASLAVAFAVPGSAVFRAFWGEHGHRIVGELAAEALPADMPAFFRDARAQLTYLNPEPDRWRDRTELALQDETAPEHFIDLEMLPPARAAGILNAPSRLAFADSMRTLGHSAGSVGLLPFRVLELTELLRVDFRLWRKARNDQERGWIEARIINDAGILGHYVADGSNPAHTTIHFNGWSGPNPDGFTTDKTFHARFETDYVQARVTVDDVRAVAIPAPAVIPDLRAGILAYLQRSNAEVVHLYTLEKKERFTARNVSPEHKRFAEERLAAGVAMLRDLWWTAWTTSAG